MESMPIVLTSYVMIRDCVWLSLFIRTNGRQHQHFKKERGTSMVDCDETNPVVFLLDELRTQKNKTKTMWSTWEVDACFEKF